MHLLYICSLHIKLNILLFVNYECFQFTDADLTHSSSVNTPNDHLYSDKCSKSFLSFCNDPWTCNYPWIYLFSILTVCLQSWHRVLLTTEAVPSCALTPSSTTKAPTRIRPELSAAADLDSFCLMTGEHVAVSILVWVFFFLSPELSLWL